MLDRFNVHRSAIPQLQERRTPWLDVEGPPTYGPDLNSVEALWSCTKHGDLANYAPDDLFDLGDAVVNALDRQRRDRRIKESYFQTARLNLLPGAFKAQTSVVEIRIPSEKRGIVLPLTKHYNDENTADDRPHGLDLGMPVFGGVNFV